MGTRGQPLRPMETHGHITLTCALVVPMSQDLRYIHEQVEIMQTSLEEDLSPSHWTIMMHVMKHMAAQLERWGPVREMWMFGFESYFGHMINKINNRNNFVANMLVQDATKLQLEMAKSLIDHMQRFGRRLHYSRVDPPLKAIAPVGTGKMKMVSPELERSIMAWMDNLPEFDDVT